MANPLLVPELRELLDQDDLATIRSAFEDSPPAMIAELLGGLDPDEIVRALGALDFQARADVFSHLDLPLQVDLVEGQGRQSMAHLLEEMSPDDRAELVRALPEHVQGELLPLLAQAERADIRRLVAYPEDSVGAVMTTDYATMPEDFTVGEALENLRKVAPDRETIYYVYVVDAERRPKGVISLKTLILAKPGRRIADLMVPEVIRVKADDDRETVAREIEKYDWLAMPVVDDAGRLVGLVTVDDVIDVIEDEADEDIYALGAAGKPLDYLQTNPFRMAGQRLPWLLLLVLVGFISATILERFTGFLAGMGTTTTVLILSFLPLLLGSGGNAGCQTTTVVVRGLATGDLVPRDVLRILRKELAVALLVGVSLAVLAAGRALIMGQASHVGHAAQLALTVALAMMATVVIAKGLGGMLPLLMQKVGLDPALMSAPLITTILDVVTLTVYLVLAMAIMTASAGS